MAQDPEFDLQAAHKYFSAHCFNSAWDLIDKSDRTPEEAESMIQLGMAAMYHWSQRPDVTDENRSIGFWQIARIYTLLGQVENARHYANLTLKYAKSEGVADFALGYAYEALARAEAAAGDKDQMNAYLAKANQVAAGLTDLESKEMLLADLDTVR